MAQAFKLCLKQLRYRGDPLMTSFQSEFWRPRAYNIFKSLCKELVNWKYQGILVIISSETTKIGPRFTFSSSYGSHFLSSGFYGTLTLAFAILNLDRCCLLDPP